MIIFLTDQQQTEIERALAQAGSVLSVVDAWRLRFQEFGWTTPEHGMSLAKTDLNNALRSIAKTMQDASGVEPVAVVDEKMGEGV